MKKLLPYLVPLLLLIYVGWRAATLSFTHDEALSYLIVKGDESLKQTANHHLLNTWLMILFSGISESELFLRLPSLIGFVLYVVFSLRVISGLALKWQLCVVIPLLFLNNYLLDFFSLARGYGLSFGLMAASIYFLLNADKHFFRFGGISVLLASLAVLCNFNMVNYFLALLAVLFFLSFSRIRHENRVKALSWLIPDLAAVTVFLVFCVRRMLKLKAAGQLYYGTDSFSHAINSISISSFDLSAFPEWFLTLAKTLMLLLLVSSGILVFAKRDYTGRLARLLYIILLILTALFAEHHFFGALYPQNRTIIFAWPLLVYLFSEIVFELQRSGKFQSRISTSLGVLVITVPLCYQFFLKYNPHVAWEWYYDAGTKNACELVLKESGGDSAILAHHWTFAPAMEYYRQSKRLPFRLISITDSVPSSAQYVYTLCDVINVKDADAMMQDGPACLYRK